MSRIGKLPVTIPSGVTIEHKDSAVKVKGPKGELTQNINPAFEVKLEEGSLTLVRPNETKAMRAQHGLYRSLINNMVEGVNAGYTKELELVGVGYRAANQGNLLELTLGYSHSVYFQVPEEVKVSTETVKGQNPKIKLECTDKQLLGHVTAEIKSLRKVEPYKGKGIREVGEIIRRKAGKTAAK
jgi:large subunit ribosomal protein L6